MQLIDMLVMIAVIGSLILVHELGHLAAAKITGIPVSLFSIGFGPAVFSFRSGGTEFRISLVPIGGYVSPDVVSQDDYFEIPVWKRILFSLGGPVTNIAVSAFLIFIILLPSSQSLSEALGGVPSVLFRVIGLLFRSLVSVFSDPHGVSGMIGIINGGSAIVKKGLYETLQLAVILGLNLGIFNLLPVPSLDGGKVLLAFLELINVRLRKIFMPAVIGGWILLVALMIFATYNDIVKLAA